MSKHGPALRHETHLRVPLKVLFAGIDGSGKTSCLHLLISRLESHYKILKIGNCDPYIFFQGEKTLLVKSSWYQKIDQLRTISLKYHFHGVFLLFNFLYKYMLSKYLETYKDTHIIMYESDTLLHPAVYITYHFPWTKKVNSRLRFRLVNGLFGSKNRFIIFYLDTDPSIATERIVKRNIDIQGHENRRDLEVLKNEFENILKEAVDSGLEIVKIDTNTRNLEAVADEMEIVLRERFAVGYQ